jgi:hypothetical protein
MDRNKRQKWYKSKPDMEEAGKGEGKGDQEPVYIVASSVSQFRSPK